MTRRTRGRARRAAATVLAIGALASLALMPAGARAATQAAPANDLSATLDGHPLKLASVANWFCDDFSYPVITCFSHDTDLVARDTAILSATSIEYVTIYDFTSYQGSFMQVSQDYTILATIGWNDRISSFKARNSLDGHFFTDWFYGGTGYYFCCNQNVPSLGSYDNTFSSVHQT